MADKATIPNILTVARIVLIPLLISAFYLDKPLSHQITALIFLIASITDFLDGYLARAWHVQSRFGRFLDPTADKLLVVTAIVMLIHHGRIDIFPALAIICREILVSGLREFLAALQVSMPVTRLAKAKTAIQMTALFLLLLGDEGSSLSWVNIFGQTAIWIAAFLTLMTGYIYLRASIHHITMEEKG